MTSVATSLPKRCPECGGTFEKAAIYCPQDGTRLEDTGSQATDPFIGKVVNGDIRIESIAGSGAMGRVYKAHQRGVDRTVAVKILHRELSGNAELVNRFHREAKIASKLQHPHVAVVHLAGQLENGEMYMVMEFLEGKTVAQALEAAGGVFPLERTLQIMMQICDAVGDAHALGIVHRDLKPENVMLVKRGESEDWVKVLDFGIARIQLGEQSMETAAGKIFGTARYISPEGAAGNRVGPPADVYALATLMYQMLAGRTPFDGAPIALLVKHIHDPPPELKSWPGATVIPDPIARVVMQNLAKDPEQRAANARAFAQALAQAAHQSGIELAQQRSSQLALEKLSTVPIDPTVDDFAAPPPIVDEKPEPEPKKKKPPFLAWFGTAFVVGAGLATAYMLQQRWRAEAEHTQYVERTRDALTDGHYVAPPGENVYDLVEEGLKRWPNDGQLKEFRSRAESEMITMAMAARTSGDIVGARNLARDAYRLDSTDNSARFTRAQLDDDLASIASGASVQTGPPRLVFESPPVVKTGEPVTMTCRIVPGSATLKAKVTNIKLTIFPNGQTTNGTPVTLTRLDPFNVRADLTAPTVGSWDVTFEAAVDGTFVRAMRDLDVTQ